MATNRNYLNISIQPSLIPRTSKTVYELPRVNLTETELVAKSTSDKTKRRVAHRTWFPRPVIAKPIVPVKSVAKPIPKKMNDLKKYFSSLMPWNVRQFNETVALDSRPQRSESTTSEVANKVDANKRKLKNLDCGEETKKKQKTDNVDKSNNKKDLRLGKKPRSHKGVDDRVKADKKKLRDIDSGEVTKIKPKKNEMLTSQKVKT